MSQTVDRTRKQLNTPADGPAPTGVTSSAEEHILRLVRSVRFGAVEVTIHDARIVQVELREKIRLPDEIPERPPTHG